MIDCHNMILIVKTMLVILVCIHSSVVYHFLLRVTNDCFAIQVVLSCTAIPVHCSNSVWSLRRDSIATATGMSAHL